MRRKTAVAVLISGRGSNMAALIEAAKDPAYPARIALALSNVPGAGGLALAAAEDVPTETIDHKAFGKDREAFERAMDAALARHGVEFIALAGFMRVLTPWFVERWAGRMINIHPSLLPKHKGLDTHARAIAGGDTEAGASVHWVSPGVDEGAVIAQAAVRILPGDTPETLGKRVLGVEHGLYVMGLKAALAGREPSIA